MANMLYQLLHAPIVVTVTQDDIDHGVKQSCVKCPIAIAATRALNFSAHVQPNHIYAGNRAYSVPWQARVFIIKFDNGGRVEPFQFELREYAQLNPGVRLDE